MKTLRTQSLILLTFFLAPPSNMSKGALLGTKRQARNSSWPSTEKCLTPACSSQSLLRDLYKAAYSSWVTSSAFLIQMGFMELRCSHSWLTSLIFLVFFSFLASSSSSTSSTLGLSSSSSSSPSLSALSSSSSSSSLSSSVTSFSVVFSVYSLMGNP